MSTVELLSHVRCQECGKEFKGLKGLAMHIVNSKPCAETVQAYYDRYLKKSEQEGKCKICGKPTMFRGISDGYLMYCSRKCAGNAPEIQEKIRKTCQERFGADRPLQSSEFQEKRRQTSQKRYGTDNPMQTPEVKEKMKKTCQERFGTDNPMQTPEVKEKHRKTCQERFGADRPLQVPEIREKMKQTTEQNCMKLYGVKSLFQIPEFQVMIQQAKKAKKEAALCQ